MSYEYSSESSRLDFPNPYKVENLFLFAASGSLFLGGIVLLLISRGNLVAHLSWWSVTPFVFGIALIVLGISYAARGMSQLRFFFGRAEPVNLAAGLANEDVGDSKGAAAIKETMRQNALTFEEPTGALNGLLYSWIPELIYAPLPIQRIAQRQFQTALVMVATLLSFLVAWIGGAQTIGLGLFYFALSAYLVLKPLARDGAAAQASLGVRGLVGLIVVAIFGPVLISFMGPAPQEISGLSFNVQTLCLLLASMGAVSMFFVALTKQLIAPPPTTMGCDTQTISINAHPKQILDELDRELQKNWSEKIPNRRYTKLPPSLNGNSGEFAGESLEETQPLPQDDMRQIDLASCFALPRYKWLGWLNVLGLSLMLMSVVALVVFAASMKPGSAKPEVFEFLTFGVAMMCVGWFCFNAGGVLWGRFDFLSELIWVEMKGNYQAAKLDYGNQFTDRIKTQKQVINIETMTLRVWVAQLQTVTFGKKTARFLVGMQGLPDKARYLAQHLAQFGVNQSMIVAPTAQEDMKRVAALGAINQLGGGQSPAALPQEAVRALAMAQMGGSAGSEGLDCPECGITNEQGSSFCIDCGCRLVAATV